jgi:hypothetical protein
MPEPDYRKIAFELVQDEDGYPPLSIETVWAYKEGDFFRLDNIPFFARGVAPGDLVSALHQDGIFVFQEVVAPSTSSVIRIYVSNVNDVEEARNEFRALGCESELSDIPKLFAVEVPGDIPFAPVADLISRWTKANRWEFEEGCVRHFLPGSTER